MATKSTKSGVQSVASSSARHTPREAVESLHANDVSSESEEENPFIAKETKSSATKSVSEPPAPDSTNQNELDRLREENARLKAQNETLEQQVDKWKTKTKDYKRKCHILKSIIAKTTEQLDGWDGVTDTTENEPKDGTEKRVSSDFSTVKTPETGEIDERRRQFYASVRPKVIPVATAPINMHLSRHPPASDLGISGMGQWRGPFEPSPLKKSRRQQEHEDNPVPSSPNKRPGQSHSPVKRMARSVSPSKRATPGRPPWS